LAALSNLEERAQPQGIEQLATLGKGGIGVRRKGEKKNKQTNQYWQMLNYAI
jgi:hypothetical protein